MPNSSALLLIEEPIRLRAGFFFGAGALINRSEIVSTMQDSPTLSRRNPTNNPNHNLWNNNGTWWLHYTCYPTAVTKERRRRSLQTRDLALARARRDIILAQVHGVIGLPNDHGKFSSAF